MSMNCSLACPALTELRHDGAQYVCVFEEWAYGLAAALLCFGGLVPLVLIISFWAKLKNASSKTKGRLRRQDSEASTFTDVSRPHDHGVYEVIRNEDHDDVFYRTRKGGFPNHKYGTFSVPNFKTFDNFGSASRHIYPDLTEVGFPESHPSTPKSQTKQASSVGYSSRISSEETIPPRLARKRRKEHSQEDVTGHRTVKFRRPRRKNRHSSWHPRRKSLEIDYASKGFNSNIIARNSSSSISSVEGLTMDQKRKSVSTKQLQCGAIDPTNDGYNYGFSKCLSFQPTPPVKHLVERMDFDGYLKDCISTLPEDQRNGTFLIRDSQSEAGCKVLAIFCKGVTPTKVLFHYKLCFSGDKVFIPGSGTKFSNIDEMIDHYREERTVLPCLLSNCLGKNF
ncbi:uncharacterized protein LOC135686011 [Rhopilema esculentum]|uniref:uncharacterized protein LOC135686011 n=1 Tax=Rhopilema esculentum TaxID=499914 RepID=UPI0031E0D674